MFFIGNGGTPPEAPSLCFHQWYKRRIPVVNGRTVPQVRLPAPKVETVHAYHKYTQWRPAGQGKFSYNRSKNKDFIRLFKRPAGAKKFWLKLKKLRPPRVVGGRGVVRDRGGRSGGTLRIFHLVDPYGATPPKTLGATLLRPPRFSPLMTPSKLGFACRPLE